MLISAGESNLHLPKEDWITKTSKQLERYYKSRRGLAEDRCGEMIMTDDTVWCCKAQSIGIARCLKQNTGKVVVDLYDEKGKCLLREDEFFGDELELWRPWQKLQQRDFTGRVRVIQKDSQYYNWLGFIFNYYPPCSLLVYFIKADGGFCTQIFSLVDEVEVLEDTGTKNEFFQQMLEVNK